LAALPETLLRLLLGVTAFGIDPLYLGATDFPSKFAALWGLR
jgi:hypothetical protein